MDETESHEIEQRQWSFWRHQSWKVWLTLDLIAITVWIAVAFFPYRGLAAVPVIAGVVVQSKKDVKGATTFKFEWQRSDWFGAIILLVVCVAISQGVDPGVILHWLKGVF